MILPKVNIEKELLQNNKIIIGIDEVGRGPLAGPVVAGAVWVRPEALEQDFEGRELIRDSKLLSEKQRNRAFDLIAEREDFFYGIGEVSQLVIDKVNILNATFLAMRFAIEDLLEKIEKISCRLQRCHPREGGDLFQRDSLEAHAAGDDIVPFFQKPEFKKVNLDENNNFDWEDNVVLLLDGNRKIPKVEFEQHLFPRGDKHIFSIAAASICAKVYRDNLMDKYDEKFPQYGFKQHKGYGTARHLDCLKKHGPCDIHRRSFAPVKELIVQEV